MSRPYFHEVQRLRNKGWAWALVIASSVLAIVPLGNGLYTQIGQGEPWGNEPMSDQRLILLSVFILVTLLVAAFMILSLELEVTIDERGVHYRFFPIKPKVQTISKEEIDEFNFSNYDFWKAGGVGFHRNPLKKVRSMQLLSPRHMELRLRTGHRLLLGTQDAEGMQWAMNKLFKREER